LNNKLFAFPVSTQQRPSEEEQRKKILTSNFIEKNGRDFFCQWKIKERTKFHFKYYFFVKI